MTNLASQVFEVIFTRFKLPPVLVCYDNACNLLEYCFNREPHFFAETVFVVDSLHAHHHTNCAPSLRINWHPALQTLVSVLAEQKNRRLGIIRKHLMYMNLRTFTIFVWQFIRLLNLEETRSLLNSDSWIDDLEGLELVSNDGYESDEGDL